jgi:hypothetical protein
MQSCAGKWIAEAFEERQGSAFPATLTNKSAGEHWRDVNTAIDYAVRL